MKSEALDAFATQTLRPGALEAAATKTPEKDGHKTLSNEETMDKENLQQGQITNRTGSAAKIVEDVVHGVQASVEEVVHSVQTVVHDVVAWTEKKAEELSAEVDSTGPYTSPATCAPSDFDPIASGMLPVMAKMQQDEGGDGGSGQEEGKEKENGGESKL
ncbi:hypothetical protein P153DRAFT_352507 [Dothidotthia symphoricarpi CBS 119687]|uniref:Uncharacterized protein n=1 Tax=Dothidotthia symphoricarpi CBS 119687 TaxID=1392245 RepID=A0A6A6ARS7_9PLEO|nr:uncharacterized protein P153DRAFT_352507 [Dothidotthia symphoricarpi CBS 119687]KAF2134520.1 hypothetical protein P153DRAFT_352507 [Dothidotthia symphoricarpi CBS 119687]